MPPESSWGYALARRAGFHLGEDLDGALRRRLLIEREMRPRDVRKLIADRQERIQLGTRVGNDHRDLFPPHLPHLRLRKGLKLASEQPRLTAHHPSRRRHDAHDRVRECCLSRT